MTSIMMRVRALEVSIGVVAALGLSFDHARAAPSCPVELGALDDAKPNKLYVYYHSRSPRLGSSGSSAISCPTRSCA